MRWPWAPTAVLLLLPWSCWLLVVADDERYVCMTQEGVPAFHPHPSDQPPLNETLPPRPQSDRLWFPPHTRGAQYHVHIDLATQVVRLDRGAAVAAPQPAGSTRVVLVGDTHGLHEHVQVPAGDVLLMHGDMMFQPRGGAWVTLEQGTVMLQDFNAFLVRQPHPHKVLIAGNHDHVAETLGHPGTQALLSAAAYLQNSTARAAGLAVYGAPVSVSLHTRNRAFQVERHSREEHAASNDVWRAGAAADVIVTHGEEPAQKAFGAMVGNPLGTERRPRLHVYGHIHGGFGVQFHASGACSINAAVLDNDFCLVHPTVVVDLPAPP